MIYGPHGAPEYFTRGYIDTFFDTHWEVHFNSSRTGVRLIGPKPEWARDDGGEAGLHPSNIHDNPYAIGAIDFTGDMPVILGPDGPSLGGFVCPVTVIEADLWQLGQLKAGDKVRFVPVGHRDAPAAAEARILWERTCCEAASVTLTPAAMRASRQARLAHRARSPAPTTRPRWWRALSGDTHLLLEIGAPELDLVLRFRVHALMQALEALTLHGVIDLTPGIRSLQIHYQPERTAAARSCSASSPARGTPCAPHKDLHVPSRIVHLPLSWDDPACQLGHREVHDHGAPGRAVVPEQPGVHPPHQRSAEPSTTCSAPCSTPATW